MKLFKVYYRHKINKNYELTSAFIHADSLKEALEKASQTIGSIIKIIECKTE